MDKYVGHEACSNCGEYFCKCVECFYCKRLKSAKSVICKCELNPDTEGIYD
jgi:hypothetical protein